MIHRIAIENFGSIREEQVLDLTLPATTPDMPRFVPSHGDRGVRLPTVVAFYGPNASGKTTVLRAVTTVLDFILASFDLTPDAALPYFAPFRSNLWTKRPTQITLDFDAEWLGGVPHVYRYEITVDHANRIGDLVKFEKLLIRDGSRFRALFKRDENGIRCAAELDLPPSDSRLKAVRANTSAISVLSRLNHPFFETVWRDVVAVQRNVIGRFTSNANPTTALQYLSGDQEALDALRHQLTRLDIGLTDLKVKMKPQGPQAKFYHEGLDDAVWLEEESNGTQRFLALFPALWLTLSNGRPALIDEFDVDLHPLLIPEVLGAFQDPETNPNKAQLFFAAHNPAIMDFLEKEEIYLVEKSRDGASRVYGLRDIKGLRRDPNLQRKYLGGIFGAVPNIG